MIIGLEGHERLVELRVSMGGVTPKMAGGRAEAATPCPLRHIERQQAAARDYLLRMVAWFMTTGVVGTFSYMPWVPVDTALILSTTSFPCTTLPNTV